MNLVSTLLLLKKLYLLYEERTSVTFKTLYMISENVLWKKVSGQFNRQLVFKQYGDKTVITRYPDMRKRKLSAKQVRVTEMMGDACEYAKGILRNEELSHAAQIRLNVTRNRLYPSLVSEYFRSKKDVAASAEGNKAKE